MATFSLAAIGSDAGYRPNPPAATLDLDDTVAGRLGDQQLAMSDNSQVLCQLPDGSQAWFTIDSSRSTPGNLVMLRVT